MRKQEDRLTQFRQHKINLLFCTDSLDSQVEVAKCNLVAMFDPPNSYQNYIKSKVCIESRLLYVRLLLLQFSVLFD